MLIGVTDGKEITIGDLDFSIENNIKLVPYGGGVSYPGESDEIRIEVSGNGAKDDEISEEDSSDEEHADGSGEEDSKEVPDNPTSKELYSDDSEKQKRSYPKNPDCGIVK